MAEIDIQRKRPTAWPWIVATLVLALAVWGIAEWFDPDEPEIADVTLEEDVTPPAELQRSEPAPPSEDARSLVAGYALYARDFATAEMGRQHEYVAGGVRRLATALDAVVQERRLDGVDVQRRLAAFHEAASQIQESEWTAQMHADEVKEAFISATDLLERMMADGAQADEAARIAVDEARQAAGSLAADEPLLEQRDAVQRFFSATARALNAMHGSVVTG